MPYNRGILDSYCNAKIECVYQKERRGTGDAVLHVSKFEDEKFLVID